MPAVQVSCSDSAKIQSATVRVGLISTRSAARQVSISAGASASAARWRYELAKENLARVAIDQEPIPLQEAARRISARWAAASTTNPAQLTTQALPI